MSPHRRRGFFLDTVSNPSFFFSSNRGHSGVTGQSLSQKWTKHSLVSWPMPPMPMFPFFARLGKAYQRINLDIRKAFFGFWIFGSFWVPKIRVLAEVIPGTPQAAFLAYGFSAELSGPNQQHGHFGAPGLRLGCDQDIFVMEGSITCGV